MTKTLCLFGFASLLALGSASPSFAAAGDGAGNSSQSVTGTQLGSPQESSPATGAAPSATGNQPGMPAADNVGPTGSRQSDATGPTRSTPSGGGKN